MAGLALTREEAAVGLALTIAAIAMVIVIYELIRSMIVSLWRGRG